MRKERTPRDPPPPLPPRTSASSPPPPPVGRDEATALPAAGNNPGSLKHAPGHPLDDEGPSLLHGSRARALHADAAAHALLHEPPPSGTAMRVVASVAELDATIFEDGQPPLVVRGATSTWRAARRWASPAALCEHYGNIEFDSSGLSPLKLQNYLEYAQRTAADFPYYVVERVFAGERGELLEDYQAPPIFTDDLADIPGTSSQPHWFLGGPRTGSLLHIDPRSTFGWNACLFGRKRWCMLSPGTDLAALGLGDSAGAEGGPYAWFADHLPELRVAATAGKVRMRECIQRPGEMVFVPFGWHHCIVNLECSCAIAHTLINAPALPAVWPRLRATYPAFAIALREMLSCAAGRPSLEAQLPELAADAECPKAASGHQEQLILEWQELAPMEQMAREDLLVKLQALNLAVADVQGQLDHDPDNMQLLSDLQQLHHQHLRLVNAGDELLAQQGAPGVKRRSQGVLFMHTAWMRERLNARPSAASVVASKTSLDALWFFHEQIQAVACTLETRNCVLCLVKASEIDAESAMWAQVVHDMLRMHGLEASGAVKEGNELNWANARGASEMAVLQSMEDSGSGSHPAPIAWALANVPAVSHIDTQSSRLPRHQGGHLAIKTVVTSDKRLGETLLRVPLSACLTSKNVSDVADEKLPEDDSYVRLQVALIELMEQTVPHPLADYFRHIFSESSLATQMVLWEPTSTAAKRAENSVAWKRARQLRIDIEARHKEIVQQLGRPVSLDRWLWATVVARTRAFEAQDGYALCPLIDLAGHLTFGASAEVRCSAAGDAMEMVARFTLREGDEVTRCYDIDDPICDFLDVFERYGFFSTDAHVHTAEVPVPSGFMLTVTLD